jgi:DNA repair photolyase
MNQDHPHQRTVGRGAQISPGNRFERVHTEPDLEQIAADDELLAETRRVPTEFMPDNTQTIITKNDSPDIPFSYSINPYRGCEHGCSYCYARPYHEMLGLNAGIDFETKILVKENAPRLLRDELANPRWLPQTIAISGVTDCYQPAERKYRITRGCLQVLLEARNPTGIITKNALVTRDIDILSAMAKENLVHVFLSITTLDQELARKMEPRTSNPQSRLQAVRELTAAGVPVGVMTAPMIPGLNDLEIPNLLKAAHEAGARSAGYTLLRLPYAVRPIFEDWLTRNCPLQADRVLSLIRGVRDGKLNDSQWGSRMRGEGPYAETIATTFKAFKKKLGFEDRLPPLDTNKFRPPTSTNGQMQLF